MTIAAILQEFKTPYHIASKSSTKSSKSTESSKKLTCITILAALSSFIADVHLKAISAKSIIYDLVQSQ